MKNIYIALFAATLLSGCELLDFGADGNETAFIYENRETGELLYCSNDQGEQTRDFRYVGTASVPKKDIKYCELA